MEASSREAVNGGDVGRRPVVRVIVLHRATLFYFICSMERRRGKEGGKKW